MRLSNYLDPDLVAVETGSRDKHATLEYMVGLAADHGLVPDRAGFLKALVHREEVVSTGVGNGVAIPHADLPDIETPRLAIGVFPGGVDFDSLDEEPVYVVFLLMGTPRTPGLHMKILARIARLSKDAEFRDKLRGAEGPGQVLDVLERIEARH